MSKGRGTLQKGFSIRVDPIGAESAAVFVAVLFVESGGSGCRTAGVLRSARGDGASRAASTCARTESQPTSSPKHVGTPGGTQREGDYGAEHEPCGVIEA